MQKCQLCGEANPPQARYCMFCRNALRNVAWSEEVRRVTVLFADLVNSTALISRSDPEDARTLLDEVVRRLRAAVRQYSGSVVRVSGDGIFALFGAPIALEDHARRAALAALRMQADIAAEPLDGPHGERLMIRVGINTGDVLIRSVASDLDVEYTAQGVTTHLAAKLQAAAEPGSVLVSAEIARLVEGFIEVRPHAPLVIRGVEETLAAFELVRATHTQTRFAVAVGRGLSPLVGREEELARLESMAKLADQGQLRVAGVVGEPGVGKSRLIWEFGLRQRERGWRVFSAHATLNGAAVAFHPVLSLLRAMHGIEPEDNASTLCSKLQERAAQHGLDVAPLLVLFGLPAADEKWDMLDTREREQRTQRALSAALVAGSREQPTLLCIEDLHEADAETLALVSRMLRRDEQARLMLLLEHRPGREFMFQQSSAYASLGVEPLAEAEARALFRQICGTQPSFATMEQQLIERVAGNPFFIEEGVRMLSELTTPGPRRTKMPIPGSVMDVIEARIAQLESPEREVIKLASAIGTHAHLPILQGISPMETPRLEASLGRLVEAGFLVQASDAPLATLRFKHAVTQDVAYRMMTRPERQKIHSDIVGLLEAKPLTTLSERIALLAQHAVKAELWQQALGYLEQAAQLATERASPREAVRLLDEALAVLQRLTPAQRSVERQIDIHLALRGPLLALGNLVRIGEELRQLEGLADSCSDPVRLGRMAVVISGHRWLSGQLRLAVESGRRAMEIASKLDDDSLLVPARQYVGAALHELGEFAGALEVLTKNIESIPEQAPGHRYGMAGLPAVFCRATRGWLRGHLGEFGGAMLDAQEAVRIGRDSGHGFSMMSGIFTASALHLARADYGNAAALLEGSLSLCENEGLRMWLPVVGSMRALALAHLGESVAAKALLERVVPDPENPVLTTPILLTVAQAQLAIGRTEEAGRVADAALQRARKGGERIWEAEALTLWAEIESSDGPRGRSAAKAAFTSALELAGNLGMRPLTARCRLGLASTLADSDVTAALHHLGLAAAEFEALDLPAWSQRAVLLETKLRAQHAGN